GVNFSEGVRSAATLEGVVSDTGGIVARLRSAAEGISFSDGIASAERMGDAVSRALSKVKDFRIGGGHDLGADLGSDITAGLEASMGDESTGVPGVIRRVTGTIGKGAALGGAVA